MRSEKARKEWVGLDVPRTRLFLQPQKECALRGSRSHLLPTPDLWSSSPTAMVAMLPPKVPSEGSGSPRLPRP